MRNRIRLLALAVVVTGGSALAAPRAANATLAPPIEQPMYCCCEVNAINRCGNKCCSPRGCTINQNGCLTLRM